MNTYLRRAAKYFCLLSVVYLAVMAVMYYTGTMAQPLADTFGETLRLQLLGTLRGRTMLAAVLVLALAYPRFGFISRRVEGDIEEHRTQIVNAMKACGFTLSDKGEENGEELLFRGDGMLKRLTLLYEDEIRVSQYGQWIELSGIRRGVVKAAWRLEGYLAHLR